MKSTYNNRSTNQFLFVLQFSFCTEDLHMKTVLIAPRKYIQGRGVLGELGSYLKLLGHRPLIAVGRTGQGHRGRDGPSRACARPGWSWSTSSSRAKPPPRERARVATDRPRRRRRHLGGHRRRQGAGRGQGRGRRRGIKHGHLPHASPRTTRPPAPPPSGTTRTTTSSASTAGRSTPTSCWSTRR